MEKRFNRRWIEADIEKLRSLAGRLPAKEVAAELGRSLSATAVEASKLGISLRSRSEPAQNKPVWVTSLGVGLVIGRLVGVSAMMIPRNRVRPTSSLEERLLKFAEEARAAAKLITPGREQDLLMRKALKAETLATAADRLGQS